MARKSRLSKRSKRKRDRLLRGHKGDELRVNPFSMSRPKRPQETRTFTDPEQPGKAITITLRGLTHPEAYKAVERAQEAIRDYIHGDEARGLPPAPFPSVAGEFIEVTEKMLYDMASVELAQVETPGEGAVYTLEELIALSVTMPAAFDGITSFYAELQKRGRAQEKNGSGVTSGIISESPSESTNGIPNSTPEPITASGPSTKDSELYAAAGE